MEEPNNTDQKSPSQPPTGRFMDIQSSSGNPATESQAAEAPEVAISPDGQLSELSANQPAPESSAPATVVQPSVSVPVSDASSDAEKPAQDTPAASEPPTNNDQPAPPEEHPPVAPKSHNMPLVAIIVAIIVTLALSGLVVYAYMKSKNKVATTPTPKTNTSQQPVTKPQASPEDVDKVSSDIDSSLSSLDDAADFSPNTMSDQALGIQ